MDKKRLFILKMAILVLLASVMLVMLSACDESEPEIDCEGHQTFDRVENYIDPTCTVDGSYELVTYCRECKTEINRETITLKKGHNVATRRENIKTCTEGTYEEVSYCKRCGEEFGRKTITVPASHDFIYCEGQPATCTESGYKDFEFCILCEYTTYEEIPALGHDIIHHDAKEATSTEIGWEEYDTCSRCDYTTYKEIPALEHNYVEESTNYGDCQDASNLTFSLNEDKTSYMVAGATKTNIKSLVIPSTYNDLPVTSIGDWAFNDCSGLTNVTIPGSVKSIGFSAFSDCSELTSVTLGNGLTTIGNDAFSECTRLQSIIIPDGVTSIGDWAFIYCSSLTNVTIPDSVTSIGKNAFYGCDNFAFNEYDNAYYLGNETNPYVLLMKAKNKKITSCEINENAKAIYDMAFSGCFDLTSVTIPANVIHIGSAAFFVCGELTNLTVANGNSVYHSEGDCIIETETKTLVLGCQNSVIPDDGSVTIIGEFAFCGCSGLTSIAIPDSVTIIGKCAFYGCSELQSVTIPANVTKIDCRAFEDCLSLTSITIPANVTEIGLRTFFNCPDLTSIEFEDTTTWYRTTDLIDWQNNTDGTEISVEDSFANVNEFNSIDYYWYKL